MKDSSESVQLRGGWENERIVSHFRDNLEMVIESDCQ